MTVYKYFIKTSIRHKWIILAYTAIFFLLALINGSTSNKGESFFVDSSFTIGVIDKSQGDLSSELINFLENKNQVVLMENTSKEYIKEQIFMEMVDAVIIMPEDFETKVKNKRQALEIVRDERKIESIKIESDINKFLVFSNANLIDDKFRVDKVKDSLTEEVEVKMLDKESAKISGIQEWLTRYFNFTGYVIMAIYISVIGLVMTELNAKTLKDRVKISSKKFLNLNMEIYLGQLTLGLIIASIFVIGSILLKGYETLQVDILKYVINLYLFSFSILCFTFLVSNLTTNKFAINGISTVVSLGTAFISGVFVPQELLGEKVLSLARFFPTYYFIKVNESKMFSLGNMGYEMFMQVLFSLAFLVLGLYLSRVRQKV